MGVLLLMKKRIDRKGRIRGKIISFRVSNEEAEILDRKVTLSRHSKQDYIISSILEKDIVVYGSPYVFRNLHDELMHFTSIYGTRVSEDDEEMMVWVLQMILAMKSKNKAKIAP